MQYIYLYVKVLVIFYVTADVSAQHGLVFYLSKWYNNQTGHLRRIVSKRFKTKISWK